MARPFPAFLTIFLSELLFLLLYFYLVGDYTIYGVVVGGGGSGGGKGGIGGEIVAR